MSSSEEYGQAYWWDEATPTFPDGSVGMRVSALKIHIIERLIDSLQSHARVADFAWDDLYVVHLPAREKEKQTGDLSDNGITLFKIKSSLTSRFPEFAELPFRKFNPMDMHQPKGTP